MHDFVVLNASSRSAAYYLRPDHIPRMLWRHRQLIVQLTRRAITGRYRGSVLGILWSWILPLVMLAVYTFVFSVVFKARWHAGEVAESKTDFALTLFCGLLMYNVFSESMSAGATAIVQNAAYVKKVVFPLEVLSVVNLGAALFNALMSLAILLLGMGLFQQRFPLTIYYLPLVVAPLCLVCMGLGWFLASIGVYVRDVPHVVGVVLQMLFFLTPIFYPIAHIHEPTFQFIMRLNPLSVIVENSRRVLMYDSAPEWGWLLAIGAGSLAVMQLGYVWFMKTKRGFADVL